MLKNRINKYFAICRKLLKRRIKKVETNVNLKALRVCLVLYAHHLLYWFTNRLISNSFHMSKVLIDYSSIIYDSEQMENTDRQICFFRNEGVIS